MRRLHTLLGLSLVNNIYATFLYIRAKQYQSYYTYIINLVTHNDIRLTEIIIEFYKMRPL